MSSPPQQPEETPAQPARAEKVDMPTLAPAASDLPRGWAGWGEVAPGRTLFLWVDGSSAVLFGWLTPGRGCVALQDVQDAGEQGVGNGASGALVCHVRVLKDGEQPDSLLEINAGPGLTVGELVSEVANFANGKLGMCFDDPKQGASLTPVIPDDYRDRSEVRERCPPHTTAQLPPAPLPADTNAAVCAV